MKKCFVTIICNWSHGSVDVSLGHPSFILWCLEIFKPQRGRLWLGGELLRQEWCVCGREGGGAQGAVLQFRTSEWGPEPRGPGPQPVIQDSRSSSYPQIGPSKDPDPVHPTHNQDLDHSPWARFYDPPDPHTSPGWITNYEPNLLAWAPFITRVQTAALRPHLPKAGGLGSCACGCRFDWFLCVFWEFAYIFHNQLVDSPEQKC